MPRRIGAARAAPARGSGRGAVAVHRCFGGARPAEYSSIVLTRLSDTTQVHLVESPVAMRRQLTFGREPVEQATFFPGLSRQLTYRGDVGGTEDHQILRLDLDTGVAEMLTDGVSRHGPFRWSSAGALAHGEGHHFRKRSNRDAFYRTLAEFFERYLLRGESLELGAVDLAVNDAGADAGSQDAGVP